MRKHETSHSFTSESYEIFIGLCCHCVKLTDKIQWFLMSPSFKISFTDVENKLMVTRGKTSERRDKLEVWD